jgi:CheY-like chemotaxis protein
MTGMRESPDLELYRSLGVQDLIPKPFTGEAFMEVLQRALEPQPG